MPILKVTVWDRSEHKKKKIICGSDAASLSEARKALSAVIGRFDTLDKILGSPSLLVLDVIRAKAGKDYTPADWNSKKSLVEES